MVPPILLTVVISTVVAFVFFEMGNGTTEGGIFKQYALKKSELEDDRDRIQFALDAYYQLEKKMKNQALSP